MPEICPHCGKEHATQEELEAQAAPKKRSRTKKLKDVATLEEEEPRMVDAREPEQTEEKDEDVIGGNSP